MSSMLSRSGQTDPGGKLTDHIDVPVSEELHHGVIALATLAGISKAEWVRRHLGEIVFGKLRMTQMMARIGRSDQDDEHPRNLG